MLSAVNDNDLYGDGADRWFTNGLRIAYTFPRGDAPDALGWAGDLLPGGPTEQDRAVVVAVGQNFYTPEGITPTTPQPEDRPWAGWLFAELGASGTRGNMEETLTLSLGVVGPASLAEEAQEFIHEITDSPDPGGWQFQLDNEPALQLFYERAWFCPLGALSDTVAFDLSPRFGADLGNVFVQASGGLSLRVGNHLPYSLAPRTKPALTGPGRYMSPSGGFAWQIFAGAEARGVVRNLFLDGSTFEDSPSVDKEAFVYEIQTGATLAYGRWSVTYSWLLRSEEFKAQPEKQAIGSIGVAVAF